MHCKDCANWNPQREESGQCRAKPPMASLIPVQGIGGQGLSVISYWPETKAADWCADITISDSDNFTLPLIGGKG